MDILFLCTGNTCRSAMAEAIAKDVFEEKGWKANVSSAGTAAMEGQPASDNARLAMERAGLDISSHTSRKAAKETLAAADLILTMCQAHKRQALLINPDCEPRIFTLGEMAGNGQADVADPFCQSVEVYERCAKEIEDAIRSITGDPEIIAVGSDHGGFRLKTEIIARLKGNGLRYIDFGTDADAPTDYPAYARKVTDAILDGVCGKGVLLCGTGIGVSIAANRVKGIRCALCHDVFSAKAARSHNDANVLAMGGRVAGTGVAMETLDAFLQTAFTGSERHVKRLAQIDLDNIR